jgi:hypothetical protein
MDFAKNNPSPGTRLMMGLRPIRSIGSNKGCKITGISGKKEEWFRKNSRGVAKIPFFPRSPLEIGVRGGQNGFFGAMVRF